MVAIARCRCPVPNSFIGSRSHVYICEGPNLTLFDLDNHGKKPKATAPQRAEAVPLAARMRPRSFDEFIGQEHLLGVGRALRRLIEADQLPSMVLWGPPGSGKTTLANLIAAVTRSHFSPLSAVSAGVADLRRVVDEARERLAAVGQRTILFIDEIHRFSKSQQDAILPYVENGTVIFIGATTENPSFEVIAPLLSRCRVFTLRALTDDDIRLIIDRALADKERGLGSLDVKLDKEALEHLVRMSNGDARTALNGIEIAVHATPPDNEGRRTVTLATVEDALQHRALQYDRAGEQHYDIISALHKSLRDSDPDAALYWMGRMLEAGEDPLFIARRLVRAASEDIGMADPQALVVAMAAQQAVQFVGMPEANLAMAEAVVYLATAPKSNSIYAAYSSVQKDVQETRNDPVPLHLRNAVTPLMKGLGYGKGYKYAHDYPGHFVRQQHLPDNLQGRRYYQPGEKGFEAEVRKRLAQWYAKDDTQK
ncbi:MAG: replication-associated recombination protein A [Chloroflexi bacterium]|nr:replication-associated recombination protein A [Chloroflexota bacterium]